MTTQNSQSLPSGSWNKLDLAKTSPAALAKFDTGGSYQLAPHLALLNKALVNIAAGKIKRLIVTMPPRHGKSLMTSTYFPAWYLGQFPKKQIILASYEALFASTFGGKARDIMERLGPPVFGIQVNESSAARSRWEVGSIKNQHKTNRGRRGWMEYDNTSGVMQTAGVGGPITGKGADLLIVDDPVKNSEDANSETLRERMWDWWQSTAYSRLEPGGAAVVIQCMTGDTPVLMADGAERPLRRVKAGDRISTYDNGILSTTTVRDQRSNGNDLTFKITTTSGRVVRANGRHPFLTDDHGRRRWTRLSHLTTEDTIVIARANTTYGRGKSVQSKAANCPPNVGGCARPITTRKSGPMDTDLHRSTPGPGERLISNTDTELLLPSTRRCTRRRMESALFAESPLETMSGHIGAGSSALTTAMKRAGSEVCCATTATSLSDMPNQSKPLSLWSNTSDFTTERIVSIEPDGVEEVFDLQVDRTENFIANGVVSHNTRWHEDDLTGKLLEQMNSGGEKWTVLNLPAIAEAEDPLGRKIGEALWPDRYDHVRLKEIEEVVGPYWWSALYQQRPTPLEGAILKRAWLQKRYNVLPEMERIIQTVDTAVKIGQDNDYSVISTWGTNGINFYLINIWRQRAQFPELKQQLVQQFNRFQPSGVYVEDTSSGSSLVQELQRESMIPVIAQPPIGKKETRLHAVTGLFASGKVYLPATAPWLADWVNEHLRFPNATHDDQVDTTSMALAELAYKNVPVMEWV